jgi:hypothetical protein
LIIKEKGARKVDRLRSFSLKSWYNGFIKGSRIIDEAKSIAGFD